mmetsp:Transcript_4947/g.7500  ORF Transcript_4947/g.7500 Transcript_4947/m.7500 type:complete len:251 (-) Transcript_4947:157-909(-)
MKISALFHEILCYSTIIVLPYSYHFAGWAGVFIYTLMASNLTVGLDFILSPTPWENVARIAREYNVSPFAIYALMAVNMLCANLLIVGILVFFGGINVTPPSVFHTMEMLRLVGSLVLYWTLSEVTFTAGHMWLHCTKMGRRIHNMHHLARNPSWSTNLLFHPIDLVVEFGGPFITMPLMHYYFIQDPFAFRIAILSLYIWYAANHSENLGLSHTTHHTSMGKNVLTIYGKYDWFERLTAADSSSSSKRV